MTILGLDYGKKRIGVAITDEEERLSFSNSIILNKSLKYVMHKLSGLIKRHKVRLIVIGLPKTLKNQIGNKAIEIIEFADQLKQNLSIEVRLFDERFTTKQAHKQLEFNGLKNKAKKRYLDQTAAQIILDTYLRQKNLPRI